MKNFEQTGNVFAEIWPELIIDGHPVVAKSVDEKLQLLQFTNLSNGRPTMPVNRSI